MASTRACFTAGMPAMPLNSECGGFEAGGKDDNNKDGEDEDNEDEEVTVVVVGAVMVISAVVVVVSGSSWLRFFRNCDDLSRNGSRAVDLHFSANSLAAVTVAAAVDGGESCSWRRSLFIICLRSVFVGYASGIETTGFRNALRALRAMLDSLWEMPITSTCRPAMDLMVRMHDCITYYQ